MAKKKKPKTSRTSSPLGGGRKRVLVVLFVPSVERDGATPIDQDLWVDAALEMLGRNFGGATAYHPSIRRGVDMKRRLDMDKIAKGLGAKRQGKVAAAGGYFGAMQLLADIEARFRVPSGGGRATDPQWTERRLVPLAPRTLTRLEELAATIRQQSHVSIEPMQLAGLLLEKSTEHLSDEEAKQLLRLASATP